MGMFTGRPVGKLWWADDKAALYEVSIMSWGADHVYSARETITLIDTTVVSARQQVIDALAVRGLDPATVTEIPFDIDASAVTDLNGLLRSMRSLLVAPRVKGAAAATDMSYMFSGCPSLVSVPAMDTGQVTTMESMFSGCSSLVDVPEMDTGQVTNMSGMFQNCSSLDSVPEMDTGKVTDMSYMFNGCHSLQAVPALDTRNVTTMRTMFQWCALLETIPPLDTSRVTEMSYMFSQCESLLSVPTLGVGSLTQAVNMFASCGLLERAPLRGLATTLDLSFTAFTPEAADELMGLVRAASGRTLTFPESAWGCDPRIAEDKRWSVDVAGTAFEYTDVGVTRMEVPSWASAVDIVALGGGNRGGDGSSGVFTKKQGYGGTAGKWISGSHAVSPGGSVSCEVGAGGEGGVSSSRGSASEVWGTGGLHLIAEGGDGWTGKHESESPGDYEAFGRTFVGAAAVGKNTNGRSPGGGGGGGEGRDFSWNRGGDGGDGMAWVRFRGGGV